MHAYPNPSKATTLLSGFKFGFSLHYSGPRLPTDAKNLKSARENPDILMQKIRKELDAGRVAGPFMYRPIPTLRISPLGLVPKGKEVGQFRVIHHLSYPENSSVNDFIDPTKCSVTYSSIDEAVEIIQTFGKHTLASKSDVRSAFRLLPISPTDFDLLGFKINDQFYFDKCLPFGASISCALFEEFASFLHWLVAKHHPGGAVVHYLDDFLFLGKQGTNHCKDLLDTFKDVCKMLGVPIADEKTISPTTCLTFLGIEIDTVEMTIRIPKDKLAELRQKISDSINCKKVTLKQMQSLLGSLNFACRVITPGRAFCRRLIDSTIGVKKQHHRIRLSNNLKADLLIWKEFLGNFNGLTIMPDKTWSSNTALQFFTDSAGGSALGFGIYFKGEWAHGSWPNTWVDKDLLSNITFLELFPVLVSVTIWGQQLKNKKVLFHIDNEAAVHILNKKSSKSPEVMSIIRKLVLETLKHNIQIKAEHVPGKKNLIADAISRCQWSRFRHLAPNASLTPTPIPTQVWNL